MLFIKKLSRIDNSSFRCVTIEIEVPSKPGKWVHYTSINHRKDFTSNRLNLIFEVEFSVGNDETHFFRAKSESPKIGSLENS